MRAAAAESTPELELERTPHDLAAEIVARSEEFAPILQDLGVRETPLEQPTDHPLAEAGYKLYVKDETQQSINAYKIRGALTGVLGARQRDPELTEVITASAGNHGWAVAQAARRMGLLAVIETAEDASPEKLSRIKETGAALHPIHGNLEDAIKVAKVAAKNVGVAYIPPFDSVDTMAGQAGVGHEMLADLLRQQKEGEIDLMNDRVDIVVPGGGGGLAAAVAAVLYDAREQRLVGPGVQITVSQLEGCDALYRKIHDLEPLTNDTIDGLSDGTRVLEAGDKTARIVGHRDFVQGFCHVTREELLKTMLYLSKLHNKTIEPAGALSMAAAFKMAGKRGPAPDDGRRHAFVTITSGANISPYAFEDAVWEVMTPEERSAAASQKQDAVKGMESFHYAFEDEEGVSSEGYDEAVFCLPSNVLGTRVWGSRSGERMYVESPGQRIRA